MQSRDAIVTGTGCICAAGKNLPQVMTALYAGARAPRPSRRLEVGLARELPVFEIDSELEKEMAGLRETEGFENLSLERNPVRTTQLALIATLEACAEANLALHHLRAFRVGVAIGTTVGCTLNDESFYRSWRAAQYPEPSTVKQFLANNPALYLSGALGLCGPVATVANACSSGADAIGLAKSWLEADLCDVAIAGGADELSRVTCLGFASLMIASPDACRPFDLQRAGLNLGEGAGILVLETPQTAGDHGASVLARLKGYGCAADAFHVTAPHPEGRGLRRAIRRALEQAGIGAEEVGFINAHGTSTPDNDRVEGAVLADLFPEKTPVISTKAYTGHTLGGAGGIEAVFTVQGLRDGKLPATAGFEEADPECRITPTRETMRVNARYAVSNSLAFGGNNAALVFEKCS